MRALTPLLLILASGCAPAEPQVPDSSTCQGNSAPFIGNLSMSSTCAAGGGLDPCESEAGQQAIDQGEVPVWTLLISFDYADPGVSGATDPPNMVGGLVSWELSLGAQSSLWLYDAADAFDPAGSPAYAPIERDANQGTVALPPYLPDFPVQVGSPAIVSLRVRDACDAESNEVGCRYLMGTGEWLDCVPPT